MAPPTESGPDAEIQDVSGSDDGSSDGGDDGPVGAAVLSVVDTLSALEPEDLDTAMLEIKAQLATVQYMASLNKIAGSVLAYDGDDGCPFPAAHRPALKALFKRASVVQHSVFKDNEWTLGPRREPCGANTTVEFVNKSSTMGVRMCFEWYWRNDDDEGFVEDYSLSIEDGEDESDSGGDSGSELDEAGAHPGSLSYVTLLEGRRSQRGQPAMAVFLPALQAVEAEVLNSGVSLQSLLRFLVMCTRTESRKCQGRAGSVTAGYNAEEDAESMRKFLCEFSCREAPHLSKVKRERAGDTAAGKSAAKRARA